MGMPKTFKIKLKSIDDLLRLTCNLGHPVIYTLKRNGKHIYLVIYGVGGNLLVPYVEIDEEPRGNYIVYDRFNSTYKVSDIPSTDPKTVNIALIRVSD